MPKFRRVAHRVFLFKGGLQNPALSLRFGGSPDRPLPICPVILLMRPLVPSLVSKVMLIVVRSH